jgi:hypothetical protein
MAALVASALIVIWCTTPRLLVAALWPPTTIRQGCT